jgi:hypothetical protein
MMSAILRHQYTEVLQGSNGTYPMKTHSLYIAWRHCVGGMVLTIWIPIDAPNPPTAHCSAQLPKTFQLTRCLTQSW